MTGQDHLGGVPCGIMVSSGYIKKKTRGDFLKTPTYFTVAEANQKIPWLEVQLQDIVSLGNNIERLRLDLDNILRKGNSNGHGDTDQEVVDNQKETDAVDDKLRNLVQEINDSGIILKDSERGLVDFPMLWEGREVYLCWLLGEASVQFWHEIDAGFAGRQLFV